MTNQEAIDLLDNLLEMIDDNQGNDYDEAIHRAIEALSAERKGKWIVCDAKSSIWWEECSICGSAGSIVYNFCPHCGADMREH